MTPGKITTEMVFTVKLTLVSDDLAISEKDAREKTTDWVRLKLTEAALHNNPSHDLDVIVIPRSHMIYDLRGLPPTETSDE